MTAQTSPATPAGTVEQLRLPGQFAAPDGPLDPFMMYLAHHGFRRDLADFARCVPRTPSADRATWRALQKRWSIFREILHHHHAGEDAWIWPQLEDRSTADERAILAAMESEHGLIDPLLEACDAGFARMAVGADDTDRADLTTVLGDTHAHLSAHLAHEESDALTLIQARLSVEEWVELEEKFGDDSSLADALRLAPWMLKGLDDDHRAIVKQRVPRPLWVLAALGSRSFRRGERRAFRYDPDATS
ncbi:hemerythrin domain-containing protein [Gordonia sp. ABSL11-1]|uniref:hemerythrin domain-containing protein n=1 Tax=Gordonia sp. ABSL11-1 TaxID=3053924 RepID=UPI002574064D|nr:hemerythrin domain-containing protein [Gordonia sp. ABSL11-1]MDL9948855.1 hemerythrin domain-containing protein [Gordonia sp. ABSL11-1]